MLINLKELSTPQLKAIRQVLVGGSLATADSSEVKRLRKENAQLKKIEQRRSVIAEIGLDLDDDRNYWLGLDDSTFKFVVGKMAELQKEVALSERTFNSIKVPALTSTINLDPVVIVREGLRNRRNGHSD